MKLLANENFPYNSVKYLMGKGFDIKSIGMDYPGITDKEVINLAIEENRTILTFDRDYGELICRFNLKPNVV
jgi:predicted nuclease of predicted toxin-antitoxin system